MAADDESEPGGETAGPEVNRDTQGQQIGLPSDPVVVLLAILVGLAVLCLAYVAAEIVLPIVLALVLKLLLQPGMRLLENLHVPKSLAALMLILLVFGTIVGIGAAISGPATDWAAKLPEGIPRLQERLKFLNEPVTALQIFLQKLMVSCSPECRIAVPAQQSLQPFSPVQRTLPPLSSRRLLSCFSC